MRRSRCLLPPLVLAATVWSALAVAATEPADLILAGGNIRAEGGIVEALAARGGEIVALGSSEDVMRLRGPGTRMLQLGGATVVPGLHDMHVHPLAMGLAQSQCRFAQGSTPAQIVAAVTACASGRAPGEWIVGGQWEASAFGKEPMHHSMLDAAAPRNPVALVDISGHSLWVSALALTAGGIDARTPDPAGGIIERDAQGAPTGVLREAASGLVRDAIPPPTAEQREAALEWALRTMLAHGITAFTDAGTDDGGLAAYAAIADRGELKQRVRACIWWRRNGLATTPTDPAVTIAARQRYERPNLRADCVKIVLDGVPTDGHTAAMLEPYAGARGAGARGMLMVPPAELAAAVSAFDRAGLTVKFHAAGDAAVRAALDAVEAARRANGPGGPLHDVGHNSFVDPRDLRRARALGATLEMSPYIWYPNPIIPDVAKAVGSARMRHFIPVRGALAAGALVVPGSDWYVVPSVDPWLAMETLVTRQAPGGKGEVLGAHERITLDQAFAMYTLNSARQLGNAGRTGAIAQGLLADLVVIDRDPWAGPAGAIHETRTLMTLTGGKVAYRAEDVD